MDNNMHKLRNLIATLVLGAFAGESAADGFYSNAHDLMVEAIRSGQASGVMGGDIASKFTAQFKSNGALLVDAKKILSYKQPGCARLAVNYTKKDVPTAQGITSAHLNTQINYCLDGRAPQSLE
jgi:hypothetical protein